MMMYEYLVSKDDVRDDELGAFIEHTFGGVKVNNISSVGGDEWRLGCGVGDVDIAAALASFERGVPMLRRQIVMLGTLERVHEEFISCQVDGSERYGKRFRRKMERGSVKRLRDKVNGPEAKERNSKEVQARTWLDAAEGTYDVIHGAVSGAASMAELDAIVIDRGLFAHLHEDSDPEVTLGDYLAEEV